MPEALVQRPSTKHNKFTSRNTATNISEANAIVTTSDKTSHIVVGSDGDGPMSRAINRMALVMARTKLPNAKRRAKSWRVPEMAIDAAATAIATQSYNEVFGECPTNYGHPLSGLVRLVNEGNSSPAVIMRLLSYAASDAFEAAMKHVSNPAIALAINHNASIVSNHLDNWREELAYINSPTRWRRERAMYAYRRLSEFIEAGQESISLAINRSKEQSSKLAGSEQLERGSSVPMPSELSDNWAPLFVSKPQRVLPHTGALGRRNMATDSGRSVRYVQRYLMDDDMRVFVRKSRGLGAVIVIDCSGSMRLTIGDVDKMIDASAGATVLCYSSGYTYDEDNPNAWLVAKNNSRIRELPQFPGGNGCDGPALVYAAGLRAKSSNPIIWISDGQVTGKGDFYSPVLAREAKRICKRYNIKRIGTVDEAITYLRKQQRRLNHG